MDLSKFQLGFSDHLSGSHQFLPFQTLTQSSNPRPHDGRHSTQSAITRVQIRDFP